MVDGGGGGGWWMVMWCDGDGGGGDASNIELLTGDDELDVVELATPT